jgi:hypothetical protein
MNNDQLFVPQEVSMNNVMEVAVGSLVHARHFEIINSKRNSWKGFTGHFVDLVYSR